jgi:hypothetical protein
MRNLAICTLIFMIFTILTSCLKENASKGTPSSSLTGNWTVVNETTIDTSRVGTTVSNYTGKPGDYFNFTTYGKLYWSINGQKDTATYLVSGDTLKFKYAYIDGRTNMVDSAYSNAYTLSNLTTHTCTLFNSTAFYGNIDSGAALTTINLKK